MKSRRKIDVMKGFFLGLLSILSYQNAYANTATPTVHHLTIEDEDHLLDLEELTFTHRDELKQKLKLLLAILIDEGFVTSSVTTENGKIALKAGKIQSVILEDSSTPFPYLKKKAFYLDLEEKILNMKDINAFITRFNKNKTNKLKVSIVNSDKPYYSNIILKNDYHFKISPSFNIDYSKPTKSRFSRPEKIRYSPVIDFEQIIGFNDKLSLNTSFDKEEKTLLLHYNLMFRDINYGFSTFLQKKNTWLFEDTYLKDNLYNFSLNIDKELEFNPTLFFSPYLKLTIEKEKETLRNTLIFDRQYLQTDLGGNVKKYFIYNQDIYSLYFSPNINLTLTKQTERENSLCMMVTNSLYFSTPYYDTTIFLGYSKRLSGQFLYDKCFHTNKVTEFNNSPLEYDTPFVSYLSQKIKYPFNIKDLHIYPFAELAIGKDFEYRKNLTGVSTGMMISISKIMLGAKYSHTKDERAVTMKVNINF